MASFTHLHVHTQYSLLDGAGSIERLLKKAKDQQMNALAITDHGNMYGVMHFFEQAKKIGKKVNVLVEVNVGREQSKSGVFPENAPELLRYVAQKPNLNLRGVMGVFPIGASEELYEELKRISDFAKEEYGADILSAGMSNDYEMAIKHGSNMVRIGSALFGKRNYN